MNTLQEALEKAIDNKSKDVNSFIWKGKKKLVSGYYIQEETRLIDMNEEQLQKCLDHCVAMLYNTNKSNPGRYVLLRIIQDQRLKCNAELYARYVENKYCPDNRVSYPRFKYQEELRKFIYDNKDIIAEKYELINNNSVIDAIKQLPIGFINNIPEEFEALPVKYVLDACTSSLGIFNKKHITLNFITKLPLWFTNSEMKELVEKDEEGDTKNRLEVIKNRLNLKNNIRLIIDSDNAKLNYTEFKAAIQLRNKNYNQLTTEQLVLLQNKLLFYLEDEVYKHIKQWETIIDQIDQVRKLKGFKLNVNS